MKCHTDMERLPEIYGDSSHKSATPSQLTMLSYTISFVIDHLFNKSTLVLACRSLGGIVKHLLLQILPWAKSPLLKLWWRQRIYTKKYFSLLQCLHKLKGRNCLALGQAQTTLWITSGWPSNRVFSSAHFILCFRVLSFVFETVNFTEEKSTFWD